MSIAPDTERKSSYSAATTPEQHFTRQVLVCIRSYQTGEQGWGWSREDQLNWMQRRLEALTDSYERTLRV